MPIEEPIRRAAIALGANLGDRRRTLELATAAIGERIGKVVAASSWIETPALIHPDDPATSYPPFLNGCLVSATSLEPDEILIRLHGIEEQLGRRRAEETARWRPRMIDLDLIALDDLVLDTRSLRLPHPEMRKRSFVLGPLAQVWPDWKDPITGLTALALRDRLVAEEAPV
jgi:2-amino-4-hydroxy-6-hydroxymethyldihydropteridine diphosphokinase